MNDNGNAYLIEDPQQTPTTISHSSRTFFNEDISTNYTYQEQLAEADMFNNLPPIDNPDDHFHVQSRPFNVSESAGQEHSRNAAAHSSAWDDDWNDFVDDGEDNEEQLCAEADLPLRRSTASTEPSHSNNHQSNVDVIDVPYLNEPPTPLSTLVTGALSETMPGMSMINVAPDLVRITSKPTVHVQSPNFDSKRETVSLHENLPIAYNRAADDAKVQNLHPVPAVFAQSSTPVNDPNQIMPLKPAVVVPKIDDRTATSSVDNKPAATATTLSSFSSSTRNKHDNLHRRYREAARKSQEIFARHVSLLSPVKDRLDEDRPESVASSINHSTPAVPQNPTSSIIGGKRVPLILLPLKNAKNDQPDVQKTDLTTAQLSRFVDRRQSDSKNIEHSKSSRLQKSEEPPTVKDDEEPRSPSPVDDSRFYNRRRARSRASEFDFNDNRSTKSERIAYNKYAQSRKNRHYDDESDEDLGSEDLDDDYYEDNRYTRPSHRRDSFKHYNTYYPPRNDHSHLMADPAWQKFLYEFYRQNGYYPTYEQLQQMWLEQQQRQQTLAVLNNSSYSSRAASKNNDNNVKISSELENQQQRQKVKTDMVARTTDYHHQRRLIQDDEKASQLSVTISGSATTNQKPNIDSDRSADVSNVSVTDGFHLQVPYKHSVPHCLARFGAGGHLITVNAPDQNSAPKTNRYHHGTNFQSIIEIRHVRRLIKTGRDLKLDADLEKLDAFPGPLSPWSTDKNALIQFCRQKVDSCRRDLSVMDRDSLVLIWNTLGVLIRQNGNVTGQDLARLLMEGLDCDDCAKTVEVESFPAADEDFPIYEDNRRLARSEFDQKRPTSPSFDRVLINSSTQTVDRIEQHFRELLFYGSKKEALEWAIKHKLWGHALFLAMKIDQRTHMNVMIRFANSLPLTDPLQTLYQMMSGVSPSAVTRLSDDKWSDWRPHLAMILSNLSLFNGSPTDERALQRELNSVMTLGHTLMDDGRTYAAQFCYLCCHVLQRWDIFSAFDDQTTDNGRLLVTLLGAHSETKYKDLFTIDRYQMTEIYEYAIGLAQFTVDKQQTFVPTIQNHKLTYSVILLELGNAEAAYKYLALVGQAILLNPAFYTPFLKGAVVNLASRLHTFDLTSSCSELDAHSIGSSSSLPQWINDVINVLNCEKKTDFEDGNAAITSSLITETTQKIEPKVAEEFHHQQQQVQKSFFIGAPSKDEEMTYANLNSQPQTNYAAQNAAQKRPSLDLNVQPFPAKNMMHFERNFDNYATPFTAAAAESVVESRGQAPLTPRSENYARGLPFTAIPTIEPIIDTQGHNKFDWSNQGDNFLRPGSRPVAESTPVTSEYAMIAADDFYNKQQQQPLMTNGPVNALNQSRRSSAVKEAPFPQGSNKFFPDRPKLLTNSPPSDINDSVFTATPPSAQQMTLSSQAGPRSTAAVGHLKQEAKFDATKRNKVPTSRSWLGEKLGGVVKKFLPKDPNEMILPDDRTKTILWDEKNGKWVNTNGDNNDEPPPPPPPSLASSAASLKPVEQPLPIGNVVSSAYATCSTANTGQGHFQTLTVAAPAKPVNRLTGYGKRYATINSFGVIQNSPNDPLPIMPSPVNDLAGSASSANYKGSYFVPQPMNDDGSANNQNQQNFSDFLTNGGAPQYGADQQPSGYAY